MATGADRGHGDTIAGREGHTPSLDVVPPGTADPGRHLDMVSFPE